MNQIKILRFIKEMKPTEFIFEKIKQFVNNKQRQSNKRLTNLLLFTVNI